MTLEGKHIVITGATAGIGEASAVALAKSGGRVTIMGRNQQKAENTLAKVIGASGRDDHRIVLADFASLKSVRNAAEQILAWDEDIDILQNNAGVGTTVRSETEDGFEQMFGVNHLAPFLLTGMLLPRLMKRGSRIVNVGSHAYSFCKQGLNFDDLQATKEFKPIKAYAYTKLCNNLFTIELAERLKPHGVTCNVLHPGNVKTELGTQDGGFIATVVKVMASLFFVTPEKGAETSNYLCESDEVANVTGKYFAKCKQETVKPWGEDFEAARRLWTISEEMTGFTYPEL